MGEWQTIRAGGRAWLKTTKGGLLAADKGTKRVLWFEVTATELHKLAASLEKREAAEVDK